MVTGRVAFCFYFLFQWLRIEIMEITPGRNFNLASLCTIFKNKNSMTVTFIPSIKLNDPSSYFQENWCLHYFKCLSFLRKCDCVLIPQQCYVTNSWLKGVQLRFQCALVQSCACAQLYICIHNLKCISTQNRSTFSLGKMRAFDINFFFLEFSHSGWKNSF